MSSTQQTTLLNFGCFWQYFVPLSRVVLVNLTSLTRFSCHFNDDW